ncbi:hypothetical protein A2U01_0092179, partial [Trifolium medium]|nr:hypothetical protein [Trifolium medium]
MRARAKSKSKSKRENLRSMRKHRFE